MHVGVSIQVQDVFMHLIPEICLQSEHTFANIHMFLSVPMHTFVLSHLFNLSLQQYTHTVEARHTDGIRGRFAAVLRLSVGDKERCLEDPSNVHPHAT